MENIWKQKDHFSKITTDGIIAKKLKKEAIESIKTQEELESDFTESYEDYINKYFFE
jgi:hypothetical protein